MIDSKQAIILLLKEDLSIYRGNVEIKRCETIQENWTVRWEDYFNPHADPKSLFSEKSFSDIEDAVDFFIATASRVANSVKLGRDSKLKELGFEDLSEGEKANIQLGRNLT